MRTIRAPLTILILAGIALTVPSQTQDMLAALGDTTWPTFAFHIALAFLAFSSWFWSRALLAAEHGVADNQEARSDPRSFGNTAAFRVVPRLVFVFAVLIGLAIGIRSDAWVHSLYVFAWAVPMWGFLICRMLLPGQQFVLPPWIRVIDGILPARVRNCSIYRRLEQLAAWAPISPIVLLVLLGSAMAIFLWGSFGAIFDLPGLPARAADLFPGPSIGLLALALIMGPLSALTFVFDGVNAWAKRRASSTGNPWWGLIRHPPVVTILVGWVLIAPTVVSLHSVRIIRPADGMMSPVDRADFGSMFTSWATACYQPAPDMHPIIVALSGGATRAGIWGERVLSEVEEATSANGPQIFAVTSVSGGSLGAAAYFAALAALPDADRCHPGKPNPARMAQLTVLAASQLGGDALGPALAGALLGDIPRSLFALILYVEPEFFAAYRISGSAAIEVRVPDQYRPDNDDRGAALEHGFEHLWKKVSHKYRDRPLMSFSAPYLSLFYEDGEGTPRPGMPVWIGNGTDSDTGTRLLTTPFNSSSWPFLAAKDVLGILQADIPISTAINNTARFPFLDPVGELKPFDLSGEKRPYSLDHVPRTDGTAYEIEDGGYFDNAGLQTAMDLASWLHDAGPALLAKANWAGRTGPPPAVNPIIVLATSDGDAIPTETITRCGPLNDDPVSPSDSHRPVQALAPSFSLYNLRGGHAAVLVREVRAAFCPTTDDKNHGGEQGFFHFYLPADGTRPIPLNWVLSTGLTQFIWTKAMQLAGNAEERLLMRQAFTKDSRQ